MISMNF
jgi:hypothetical protein